MKKNIHSILSILIISFLLITTGCGGGNDGITPSSIPDTTNNNNTIEGGYIKVTVVWPQNGVEGKCLFTSGENTITTSMPKDAKAILVTVRSGEVAPIFKEYKTQWHLFEWEPGEEATEETETLFPIPAVKVIVRAQAWNLVTLKTPDPVDPNAPPIIKGSPISDVKDEVDIILGEDNEASLDMGGYYSGFFQYPNMLIIPPFFKTKYLKFPDKMYLNPKFWINIGGYPYYQAERKLDIRIVNYNELGGNVYFLVDGQEKDIIEGVTD